MCILSHQFSTDSSSPANSHHHKTLGALDMGGASTEITFIPEDPSSIEPGFKQSVQLHGTDYTVYSHSYQCFGQNEAYRRYLGQLVKVGFAPRWYFQLSHSTLQISSSSGCRNASNLFHAKRPTTRVVGL